MLSNHTDWFYTAGKVYPKGLEITEEIIDKFWNDFYYDLLSASDPLQPKEIYKILFYVSNIQMLVWKPPKKTALSKIIPLLIKIGTTKPVFSYKTQILAFYIINMLLPIVWADFIEVEWRPIYEFFKNYLIKNTMSSFNDNESIKRYLKPAFSGIMRLSTFFSPTAAKEIYEEFVSKISPCSLNSYSSLLFLSVFNPRQHPYYRPTLELALNDMRSAGSTNRIATCLLIIATSLVFNIDSDFSFVIKPIIAKLVSILVFDQEPKYISVDSLPSEIGDIHSNDLYSEFAHVIILLFLSKHTREEIIRQMGLVFNSSKIFCHPAYSENLMPYQLHGFITSMFHIIARFKNYTFKENPYFKVEDFPTADEFARLYQPMVNIHILSLDAVDVIPKLYAGISVITKLTGAFTNRYIDYALQATGALDSEAARRGWGILIGVLPNMDDSRRFDEIADEIIHRAMDCYYVTDMRVILNHFFTVFFSICPLSAKNKHGALLDRKRIAERFVEMLLEGCISAPTANGKLATLSPEFSCTLNDVSALIFSGADDDVNHSLLPSILEMVSDFSLSHAAMAVYILVSNYLSYASEEDRRRVLERSCELAGAVGRDISSLKFVLYNYAMIASSVAETEEDIRCAISNILKHCPPDRDGARLSKGERKIASVCWAAVGYTLYNEFALRFKSEITAESPDPSTTFQLPEHIKVTPLLPKVSTDGIANELLIPIVERIMEEEDTERVMDMMKVYGFVIEYVGNLQLKFDEGDMTFLPRFVRECSIRKPGPLLMNDKPGARAKILELSLHLLTKYAGNSKLFKTAIKLAGVISRSRAIENWLDVIPCHFYDFFYQLKDKIVNQFRLQSQAVWDYDIVVSNVVTPLTGTINKLFERICELAVSDIPTVQDNALECIDALMSEDNAIIMAILHRMIGSPEKYPRDEFVNMVWRVPTSVSQTIDDKAACNLMLFYLRGDVEFKEAATEGLMREFINALNDAMIYDREPVDYHPVYSEFLDELDRILEEGGREDRTFYELCIKSIQIAMRAVRNLPKHVYEFVLKASTYNSQFVLVTGLTVLGAILERRMKEEREKNEVEKIDMPEEFKITFDDEPDLFDDLPYTDETTPDEALMMLGNKEIDCKWIREYESEEQGFYAYSKKIYKEYEYKFHNCKEILELIPKMTQVITELANEPEEIDADFFNTFGITISRYAGPFVIEYAKEAMETSTKDGLTEISLPAIAELITGISSGSCKWPIAEIQRFTREVSCEFVKRALMNPAINENISYHVVDFVFMTHPLRVKPLLDFLFNASKINSQSPMWRKNAVSLFSAILTYGVPSYAGSVEHIYNSLTKPCFEHLTDFNNSIRNVLIAIFFSLIEISCAPSFSPMRSEKKYELAKEISHSIIGRIKNSDLKDQKIQSALSSLFFSFQSMNLHRIGTVGEELMGSVDEVLKIMGLIDVNVETDLVESISDFIVNPVFLEDRHDGIADFVIGLLKGVPKLPTPMQRKIIKQLPSFVIFSSCSFSPRKLEETIDVVKALLGQCGEGVRLSVLHLYGALLTIGERRERMSVEEACGIVASAAIVDEVPEEVVEAFNVLEDHLGRNGKDAIAAEVVRSFWHVHTDHIAPAAESVLSQFRTMIPPPYVN